MNKDQLRQQAQDAIARWQDPTKPKPPGEAVVQFGQRSKLPKDFPIAAQYLGCNRKGLHVYNLSAKAILQYLDRVESEFENVNGGDR